MTVNKLNDIFIKISVATFFDFLKKLDIDESLDARDEDPFDSQWMDNFNRLENESFDKDDLNIINKIREYVFKESFRVVESDEISARISDDFELIAKDLALNEKNSWPVNYLWKSYEAGIFPV
ncbi:hypothetical protein [Kalamiella sp. sgz302252]|uniref:hypothetical protein n=1 Tax=Pantoea sp. sgz302252 TaxID=3341827 RepID=UPI0036D431AB